MDSAVGLTTIIRGGGGPDSMTAGGGAAQLSAYLIGGGGTDTGRKGWLVRGTAADKAVVASEHRRGGTVGPVHQ